MCIWMMVGYEERVNTPVAIWDDRRGDKACVRYHQNVGQILGTVKLIISMLNILKTGIDY